MATEFEVSFQKAFDELLRLKAELQGLGRSFDDLGKGVDKRLVNELKGMNRELAKVTDSFTALENDKSEAFRTSATDKFKRSLTSLANQSFDNKLKISALKDETHNLHGAFTEIARDKSYIRTLQNMQNAEQELINKEATLQQQLKLLKGTRGENVETLKLEIAETRKAIREKAKESKQTLSQMQMQGNLQSMRRQAIDAQREMAVTGQKVAWGLKVMTEEEAKFAGEQRRATTAVKAHNDHLSAAEQRSYMASKGSKQLTARLQELQQLAHSKAGAGKIAEGIAEVARIAPDAAAKLKSLTQGEAKLQLQVEKTTEALRRQNEATQRTVSLQRSPTMGTSGTRVEGTTRTSVGQDAGSNVGSLSRQWDQSVASADKYAQGLGRIDRATAEYMVKQERQRELYDQINKDILEGQRNLQALAEANTKGGKAAKQNADEWASADAKRRQELNKLREAIEQRYGADQKQTKSDQKAKQETKALTDAFAEARRQVSLLTKEEAKYQARVGMLVTNTQALNASMVKNAESAQRAKISIEQLDAALQNATKAMSQGNLAKANNILSQLSAQAGDATNKMRLLSKADAEYTARQKLLTQMVELRNRAVSAAADGNVRLTSTQKKLVKSLHEERLANEALASARNRSISKMLGMGSAYDTVTHSMKMQQQAASALRATLSGLHASIGMYTSATILMATAAYAVSAAIRNTVTTAAEFGETMSRVEAIMFSGTSGFENVGDNMAAVEAQIRALGQSTIFTSNEVAQGMVDLGMAGLNATQAMEGIRPALDLASIGAISMSRSADIATNVLTTFKMEADQLGEVVDIMAVAVTNSNTNVEQLANALTYVGPAAQAAGFELKDTVAAIELLSNAGIKASKAGTGLRRFMLNLLNPTKKGKAVLDKYNISLADMNGETRDLTDIVRQFGSALMDDAVSPAERMAAIVDLVGVRAASAVSRMVSSYEDLELIRFQLEDVTNAATEMRETIEDNLSADWKKVISAFSEVQKEAFDPFEQSLRNLSAKATLYMQEMLLPFEETDNFKSATDILKESAGDMDKAMQIMSGADMDGAVSKVTILAYELRDLAMSGMYLGGAFASVKLAGFASALAGADKGSIASAGRLVSAQMKILTADITAMTGSAQVGALAMMNMSRAGVVASASVGVLGGALTAVTRVAQFAGTAITFVGNAFARILPFAGWALAIYSVGSAISLMLSDSDDHLEEHREKVDQTKEKYKELQDRIEEIQGESTRSALLMQVENTNNQIKAAKEQLEAFNTVLEKTEDPGTVERLQMSIRQTEKDIGQMERAVDKAWSKLNDTPLTPSEMVEAKKSWEEQNRVVADLENEIARLNKEANKTPHGYQAIKAQVDTLNVKLSEQREILRGLGTEMKETGVMVMNLADTMRNAAQKAFSARYLEGMAEARTNAEKLQAIEQRRYEINKRMNELQASGEKDASAGGWGEFQELGEELIELREEEADLLVENNVAYKEAQKTRRENLETQRMENIALEEAKGKLSETQSILAAMDKAKSSGVTIDMNVYNDYIDRENELQSKISEIQDEAARKREQAIRKSARDQAQAVEDLKRRMDQAIKELFPERELTINYEKTLSTIDKMVGRDDEYGLTEEQADRAREMARKDYDDKMSNVGPAGVKKRLSEEYLDYSTDSLRIERDQSKIKESFGTTGLGKIAMSEWNKQRKESVLGDDVPELGSSTLGAGDSDKIEEHRAKLEEWHTEQVEKEKALYEEMQRQQAEGRNKEFNAEATHKQRLAILEGTHAKKKERLDKISNQVRLQDTAKMFGAMAGLSATMVGDSARLTQGLLAFEQAATIASTIQNMANGQAKSFSELGPIAGAAAAAGLVAQTASLLSTIGSVVSPQEPDTSTSNYSGAYDKGGYIPAGKYGVVGEYGPELVHGPAAVTGRRETAEAFGNKGNGGGSISLAPQVNVTVQQQGSEADAKKQGKAISQQVSNAVMEVLHKEMRPNGTLDKWKRGKY